MGNIILIGMPGAGKSTIGVVLAKSMGYSFIDSDLVIQEKTGRLLHTIIEEEGVEGFNAVENDINSNIRADNAVIATGGSAVYGKEAMEHFCNMGTVVYLSLGCEEIAERLGDLNERGVVIKKGQTLEELYKERVPLYEKYAMLTVYCDNRPIRDIVREIREKLSDM